jgi:hypothetical protein
MVGGSQRGGRGAGAQKGGQGAGHQGGKGESRGVEGSGPVLELSVLGEGILSTTAMAIFLLS